MGLKDHSLIWTLILMLVFILLLISILYFYLHIIEILFKEGEIYSIN